jgi:signal transduction histidine kinase
MTGRRAIDERRAAIDEALHELRRPLQALALLGRRSGGAVESSTRMAALALERLERELEGEAMEEPAEAVRCEAALRAAVGRWRARVALGGGSLELRWRAGERATIADGAGLEQAVDNLIVNAIEHGGPRIVVEGRREGALLTISVTDSGRASRVRSWRDRPAVSPPALARGARRGHGLRLVRRFAEAHGGRFVLERGDLGTVARLELPLPGGAADLPAA